MTTTMAETDLMLSLTSLPLPQDAPGLKEELSLDRILHQIGRERGSFRNFTEESIQAELEDPEHALISLTAPVSVIAEDDKKAQVDTRVQLKETLLTSLGTALNESALALDFLSLLLSNDNKHADASMSPALKQATPAGSLAYHPYFREEDSAIAESGAMQVQQAALGLLSHSLTSASDQLSKASDDADSDRALDQTFWRDVAALQEAGWHVFKPRSGTQTSISVHFGPHPSHAITLNRSATGSIDTSTLSSRDLSLRCNIRKGSSIVASYSEHHSRTQQDDTPTLANKLTRARQSIYDEGLFSDLVRECQMQTHLAAQVEPSSISFLLSPRQDVALEIQLIEDQDQQEETTLADSSEQERYSVLARTVFILLNEGYLKKQQQPRDAVPSSILTGIIGCLTFGQARHALVSALEERRDTLNRYEWEKPAQVTVITNARQQETEDCELHAQRATIQFSHMSLQSTIAVEPEMTGQGQPTAVHVLKMSLDTGASQARTLTTNDLSYVLRTLDREIQAAVIRAVLSDAAGDAQQVSDCQVLFKNNRLYQVSIGQGGRILLDWQGREGSQEPHEHGYKRVFAFMNR
ncbi:subunit 17 of mediator complex-domain-containing protein [Protomyces lactucae-debilis]|uniref:Mediator of RNA polymerase II transcription subunit 17 n=1 Tax=Protomyces lactucae-debilis TaxID=2754530 RepID=A0A1Y2FAK3_PROLT|nr:subunit 17 of mediator complex-domain-containing protein [Protomyces lactucae-debilis]ORY79895.1 subunit 17 of mediator complex-domain-containing protein [Protomyces lactucae-debilis]